MKKGDKVTAWVNPKHYKYNTGEDGVITEVFNTRQGNKYKVTLNDNRGNVLLTSKYLTILIN